MHHSFAPAIRPGASIILVVDAGPDGCCRLLNSGVSPGLQEIERGKSELRRAVCRITSGKAGSSLSDGKCHREYTAPPFCWAFAVQAKVDKNGGAKVKKSGKRGPPPQQKPGAGKTHTRPKPI